MNSPSKSARIAFGSVLLLSLLLLAIVVFPLWRPLFMAAVLASALTPVCDWTSLRLGKRRRLAATLVTIATVLLLLLPFTVLVTLAVQEALAAYTFVRDALEQGGLEGLARQLPDQIERPLRRLIEALPVESATLSEQAAGGGRYAATLVRDALAGLSDLLFSLAMFLVAFYALLVDGRRLVDWIEYVSPLPELQTLELLGQFRRVSGSVLGSSLITAIAQSAAATVGYLVAGVPNPFFFALLTFFASFLPSVGTAIIAFPLVGLLAVMGQVWQPIFLAAWALVVVGLVDNLLKPLLIRSGMELHGVIVFFSLIGGVLVFGAIGLLAGPLIVSFFLAMVRFARRDFQASAAPL